MESSVSRVGDHLHVQPPQRDRRRGKGQSDAFRRELEEAAEVDGPHELRDEVVLPQPRRDPRPISPPERDEVGLAVDVEA